MRIFHRLNRFSEDMDFSLIKADPKFSMADYLNSLKEGLKSYGFEMNASYKKKQRESAVQSAFLKGNTSYHLVKIMSMKKPISGVPNNALISLKVEVDTDPPNGATYERLYRLLPSPFSALLFDRPSLFAGKVHALLCRNWLNREKGRDFYDYVWYLQKDIELNIVHLENRMRQTGHWQGEKNLTKERLVSLLEERFTKVNFNRVKDDVIPFISDPLPLSSYNREFFISITQQYLRIKQP
ncbi:MAG: nucleotidyl transferase AbiEii/AbiGii toxin family protein [Sphaerochaetaceae bacterium]